MMAKKLLKNVQGSETKRTYPVGKTVASKIHTSKTVSKVKKVQKAAKPLNKPAFPKKVK